MGFGVTLNAGTGKEVVLGVLNSRSVGRTPAFGARLPFSRLGFSFRGARRLGIPLPHSFGVRRPGLHSRSQKAGSEEAGPLAPQASLRPRKALGPPRASAPEVGLGRSCGH